MDEYRDPPPFTTTWQDQATTSATPINRWRLAGLILISTVASLAAWAVSSIGLSASGLYFIVIPAVLAAADEVDVMVATEVVNAAMILVPKPFPEGSLLCIEG